MMKSYCLLMLALFGTGLQAASMCQTMAYCAQHCAYARQAKPVEIIVDDTKVVPPQNMGHVLQLFGPACQTTHQSTHHTTDACSKCHKIAMSVNHCDGLMVYGVVMQWDNQAVEVRCQDGDHFTIKPAFSRYDYSFQLQFKLESAD